MALLTLKIVLDVDDDCTNAEINYDSVELVLKDDSLRTLFDEEMVKACEIRSGKKRIAGLAFMNWDRLRDAIISNSVTLLEKVGKKVP